MSVTAEMMEALDLSKLHLPSSPHVIQLTVEDYETWDGEPALKIQAIIDEDTDFDHVSGHDIGELKFVIGESLRRHGIQLFPYISIVKPSELADDDEDQGE